MGVKRLRGFIDTQPELLQNYWLHDTRLVIDGNNLLFYLYFHHKLNVVFGGEYRNYEHVVRDFFEKLQSCNVLPCVIFDGCDDTSGRKLGTVISRVRDRLRTVRSIGKGGNGMVLPPLASETFRAVLDTCGIPHGTCQMEADEEIAALANTWDCPVLSNDSDFFVFPLQQGLVLLDALKLKKQCHSKTEENIKQYHLQGKLYKLDQLRNHYPGVDAKRMALMATLQGNDYIHSTEFETIFTHAELFQIPQIFPSSKFHANMKILLEYLGSEDVFDNAVEFLVSFIPKHKQDRIEDAIRHSIGNYVNVNRTTLTCYVSHRLVLKPVRMSLQDSLQSHLGVPLPDWFLSALSAAEISTHPCDALVNHRAFLRIQVEDHSQRSSYHCAQPIRAFMYGILSTLERVKHHTLPPRVFTVEEIDRDETQVARRGVPANVTLPGGTFVPALDGIPSMPIHERRHIYCKIMGTCCGVIPPLGDLEFLLTVIAYWMRYARPAWIHLYALWLCVLRLNVILPVKETFPSQTIALPGGTHTALERAERGVTSLKALKRFCCQRQGHCKQAATRINNFIHGKKKDKMLTPNVNHIHVFAQFQAVYMAALDLNAVLGCPILPNSIANTYQGTFIHNMTVKLGECAEPFRDILTLLGQGSPLASWYQNSMLYIQDWIERKNTSNTVPSAPKTKTDNTEPSVSKTQTGNPGPSASKTKTGNPGPNASKNKTGNTEPSVSKTQTGNPGPSASKTKTGNPGPNASKNKTGNPGPSTSKIQTGNTELNASKTKTGNPGPSTSKTKTGNTEPNASKTKTGNPGLSTSKTQTGKTEPNASKTKTGNPGLSTSKTKTGSPGPSASKTKTGNPGPSTSKTKTGNTEPNVSKTKTKISRRRSKKKPTQAAAVVGIVP